MKSAQHIFNTAHGKLTVNIDIFEMDNVEAIDVYELDRYKFNAGGYRIEGCVNRQPMGVVFCSYGTLGEPYFGEGTEDIAKVFLNRFHKSKRDYSMHF